jgi:coenzyme F420 hydrogenase subunit beta
MPGARGKALSFADLQQAVIDVGRCGKCGGCVSFCSAGGLGALAMSEDGLPLLVEPRRCLHCGLCYLICPFTHELDEETHARFGWQAPFGACRHVASARATSGAIRSVATDGGVVTALLVTLLETGSIEAAIVSPRRDGLRRAPRIATTAEEIIAAAGCQLAPTEHLEQLGQQYTTYSPTIAAVKGLAGERLRKVALVGVPCQVRTVRKMQALGIIPSEVITHVIGLFCCESLVLDEQGLEYLRRLGVPLPQVRKLNIKECLLATLQDGSEVRLPLEALDPIARRACLSCPDFSSELADLSVGGLGSPPGFTTVIVRNDRGWQSYSEALRRGQIEELAHTSPQAAREHRAQLLQKVEAFCRWKQERAARHQRPPA